MGSSIEQNFLAPYLSSYLPWLYLDSKIWMVIGFLGTFTFGSRFIIQWWASERKKQIVVPAAFWYLSFIGSLLTLIYVIHLDKAPLILGNLFLPILYGRNLVLHRRGIKKIE
ncbi:MAG: lipid-A-disaccharide synthase N-terminal domain-containing protein [Verrucomicrobiota bacterium]